MVVKLRSRSGVVVATIWLAAVAGVSVTAWVAIDRAGRGVTGADAGSLLPVTVATADATTAGRGPSPSDTTPDASATPKPSAIPGPSSKPKPFATLTSATARDRTLGVAGGLVSVRCTGATILLRIAQPDNGWRVEVHSSGPAEVDLSFRLGDDDSGVDTRVKVVCATGTPVFKVANRS